MSVKITPKLSRKINALILRLCCNCFDGNCLLLDDGDEHSCVQLISKYGVYCNYFKNAVLPADKKLFAEVMMPRNTRHCLICDSAFVTKSNRQKYCERCARLQARKKDAERKRRKRNG